MLVLLTALGCARPAAVVAPELPVPTHSTHAPSATPVPGARPADPTLPAGLSTEVAAVMDRYPIDGSYAYFWPPDDGVWWGTTRDVRYEGLLLSPADPDHRSHCVGLTWEVALEVLQAVAGAGPINGMGLRDMLRLRGDWFVRELGDPGAAAAVEHAGVGVRVPWDQLQRGDFLQLWWTETGGHSGIFDRYELEEGRIVGLRYWSTHPFLGGIGYWTDPVERLHAVYGARLLSPEDWSPVAGADRSDLARDVPPPPGGQGP
jgi:hypothetical protein